MSQYPPPYPPNHYAAPIDFSFYLPGADLLAPARRAGTLMIVLGALIALFGACNGGSALMLTPEQIAEHQASLRTPGMPEMPITPERMRILSAVVGGMTALVGIGLIANGAFIRRGSGTAITIGLVLCGGLTLLIGMFALMFLVTAVAAPSLAPYACMLAIPLVLLIWLLVWLIAAARTVSTARQQYQSQFYGYQPQQPYAAPAPYSPPPVSPGYAYPPPLPPGEQGNVPRDQQ